MSQLKARRRVRRHVTFESLEGRLALSTVAPAPEHAPAQVVRAQSRHVPGSFTGTTQLITPFFVVFDNMKGNLGKLKLTGHGTGFINGSKFTGGSLLLTGKGGTLTVRLGPAAIKKNGKNGSINSQMVIAGATGSYAKANGSAGAFVVTIQDLQKWDKKTKSLMTDKADVNSLSSAAYFLLESTDPPPTK
jgi:hypothetical protein